VFFVDDDRQVHLRLLKEQADKYAVELIGYVESRNVGRTSGFDSQRLLLSLFAHMLKP